MADKVSNKNDGKIFIFGALFDSSEFKKYGITICCGLIGATIASFIFGQQNKPIVFIIALAVTLIGYFVVANKIIKKK